MPVIRVINLGAGAGDEGQCFIDVKQDERVTMGHLRTVAVNDGLMKEDDQIFLLQDTGMHVKAGASYPAATNSNGAYMLFFKSPSTTSQSAPGPSAAAAAAAPTSAAASPVLSHFSIGGGNVKQVVHNHLPDMSRNFYGPAPPKEPKIMSVEKPTVSPPQMQEMIVKGNSSSSSTSAQKFLAARVYTDSMDGFIFLLFIIYFLIIF